MTATYYAADGTQVHFDASGDTWGNHGVGESDGSQPKPPYGHLCSLAPGHYELGQVDDNGEGCVSEGRWQIHVNDLSDATKNAIIAAGKGVAHPETGTIDIGGIDLPRGGIAKYERAAVMIHGGGSNLGVHALDDNQPLLRTWGCTRVHNADLNNIRQLVQAAHAAGHAVIFSCVGDPAPVNG